MSGGLAFRHGRVQRLRRLLSRAGTRRAEGAYVVEGAKLVAEALDSGVPVEALYVTAGCAEAVVDRAGDVGLRVFELAPGVLERIASTVTPQPVVAVVRTTSRPLSDLRGKGLVVVCAAVRDPGNLGTVLRSAEASGVAGVVCCDGSVDVYNPKCVRASAGSLFHVRLAVGGDPVQVLDELGRWPMARLGTRAEAGTPYYAVNFDQPMAIVLGNEAHGLSAEVSAVLDGFVTIPMAGRTESLNVGMAAAVLCFEATRPRRSPGDIDDPR